MMKSNLANALNLAWQLGYTIAIPIVILGLGGAYLDKYLKTSPLFLLFGIGFSIMISSIAIVRKTKKILEDLSRLPPSSPASPRSHSQS